MEGTENIEEGPAAADEALSQPPASAPHHLTAVLLYFKCGPKKLLTRQDLSLINEARLFINSRYANCQVIGLLVLFEPSAADTAEDTAIQAMSRRVSAPLLLDSQMRTITPRPTSAHPSHQGGQTPRSAASATSHSQGVPQLDVVPVADRVALARVLVSERGLEEWVSLGNTTSVLAPKRTLRVHRRRAEMMARRASLSLPPAAAEEDSRDKDEKLRDAIQRQAMKRFPQRYRALHAASVRAVEVHIEDLVDPEGGFAMRDADWLVLSRRSESLPERLCSLAAVRGCMVAPRGGEGGDGVTRQKRRYEGAALADNIAQVHHILIDSQRQGRFIPAAMEAFLTSNPLLPTLVGFRGDSYLHLQFQERKEKMMQERRVVSGLSDIDTSPMGHRAPLWVQALRAPTVKR